MSSKKFLAESNWLKRFIAASTLDQKEIIVDLLWFEQQVIHQKPDSLYGALRYSYMRSHYPESTLKILEELDPWCYKETLK